MPTKIEWAEESWNPVTGCTPVSEGCENCYAARMAKRLAGRAGYPADDPFKVTLHPERLEQPLKWRKPRRIFVCSMGDLFHPDVPFWFVCQVMAIVAACPQHQFLFLTKRAVAMHDYFTASLPLEFELPEAAKELGVLDKIPGKKTPWPPKNIWLGVTAENQARADERIPVLLSIPAAVHFVSIEPCLGPVNIEKPIGAIGNRTNFVLEQAVGQPRILAACPECEGTRYFQTDPHIEYCSACGGTGWGLDWIILGGESGPGARPVHPDWVRSVRDQCQAAGVPFFFKQWGEWIADEMELPGEGPRSRPEPYRWFPPQKEKGESIGTCCYRVGKKEAGRELDGRTWEQYPAVTEVE